MASNGSNSLYGLNLSDRDAATLKSVLGDRAKKNREHNSLLQELDGILGSNVDMKQINASIRQKEMEDDKYTGF